MQFFETPTRNLFFTGKGGVGKTSVACAAAVQFADRGKRVLLVSTDPASNLDEVLGVQLHNQPTPVPGIQGLFALNLDPEQAAAEYRERMVSPYRGVLPTAAIASMEEQFSGSCTLEIAAFDSFSKLLADPDTTRDFDHVLFDTAPTGHTLRLLTLPSAWSEFMENSTTGTSCLGPLAGLQAQQHLYRDVVNALADPSATTLVLVTRGERSAIREAAKTSHELAVLGITNQHLVINGVFNASSGDDPYAIAMQQRGVQACANLPSAIATLPRTTIPYSVGGILGIESLRRLGQSSDPLQTPPKIVESLVPVDVPSDSTWSMHELVDQLAQNGHGVILSMGKGGVGKTTIAAAVAVALAERGHAVHLTTTDAAAHLLDALSGDSLRNLTVDRIDPVAEVEAYRREVIANAGAGLDEHGVALLEEDLKSPCTEEIAVFRAFARAVAEGQDRFVVLDTAPTGHTILLLDSALAYHREVSRQASNLPESVAQLLPRLRDPKYSQVLIVTLAEATPVHEAAQLQRDLKRAQIQPFAWVINQCLVPLTVTDPGLIARQSFEQRFVREVLTQYANHTVIVPWQIEPPVGLDGLNRLMSAVEPMR